MKKAKMRAALMKAIADSGMSSAQIAKAAGVSLPSVTLFRRGKDIRLTTAERLADYFGLELRPRRSG